MNSFKIIAVLAILIFLVQSKKSFLNEEVKSAQTDACQTPQGQCPKCGPGYEPWINDAKDFAYSSCSKLPDNYFKQNIEEEKYYKDYNFEILDGDHVDHTVFAGTVPINDVYVFEGKENIYNVQEPYPRMFYWFFGKNGANLDDQVDPNIPIILWLQGGPGASGQFGAVTEMGPFRTTKRNKFVFPKHSWTQFAHMLFIDQPLGVGLSVSPDNTQDATTCENRIPLTTSTVEAMAVVDQFLERLFSGTFDCETTGDKISNIFLKLKKNPFYVFGESYAGHYGPELVSRLIKKREKLQTEGKNLEYNLVGLGIGDGWTQEYMQNLAYPTILMSGGVISDFRNNYYKVLTGGFAEDIMKGNYQESRAGSYCFDGSSLPNAKAKVTQTNDYNFQSFIKDTEFDIHWPIWICQESVKAVLSDKLHIVPRGKLDQKLFKMSSNNTYFTFKHQASKNYNMNYTTIFDNVPTLIYQGQFDHDVSNNGVQNMIADIDWKEMANFNRAQKYPFTVEDLKTGITVTVGNKKQYGNFNFVFINKAGHLVPTDQLYVSHELVSQFVSKNL